MKNESLERDEMAVLGGSGVGDELGTQALRGEPGKRILVNDKRFEDHPECRPKLGTKLLLRDREGTKIACSCAPAYRCYSCRCRDFYESRPGGSSVPASTLVPNPQEDGGQVEEVGS